MDLFEIAEKVRTARAERNMTQAELASVSSVSRTTIAQLEAGQAFDMRFSSIVAILDALGLSLRLSDSADSRPTFEDLQKEARDGTPGMGR